MTGKRKNCQNGKINYSLKKKMLKEMPTTPLSSGEKKKVALGKKWKCHSRNQHVISKLKGSLQRRQCSKCMSIIIVKAQAKLKQLNALDLLTSPLSSQNSEKRPYNTRSNRKDF